MNSLFKGIYDAVIVQTNRPNIQEETIAKIQTATLDLHGRSEFKRDAHFSIIQSTGIGQSKFKFTLPTAARIRRVLGVQPVSDSGCLGKFLRPLKFGQTPPPNCGGYYSIFQNELSVYVNSQYVTQFQLYYLAFPNIAPGSYSSWIAETYPHFISDLAAARVLQMIGIRDKANDLLNKVGELRVPGSYIWTLVNDNPEVERISYE